MDGLENPNSRQDTLGHRQNLASDMGIVFQLMQSVAIKMTSEDFDTFNPIQNTGTGRFVEKNEMEMLEISGNDKLFDVVVLSSQFNGGGINNINIK